MTEVVNVSLQADPTLPSQLKADALLILRSPKRKIGHESVRCLDWSLNHQIRKACEAQTETIVFIPTMTKIKPSYVILSQSSGKDEVIKNIKNMGLKSISILSEHEKMSANGLDWSQSGLDKIYLFDEDEMHRGVES